MTESDTAAPQPSLIQQRMALQRRRVLALIQIGLAAALLALWIVMLAIDGGNAARWLGVLAMSLLAVTGIFSLRNTRRAIHAFETEHGTDAGVQKP